MSGPYGAPESGTPGGDDPAGQWGQQPYAAPGNQPGSAQRGTPQADYPAPPGYQRQPGYPQGYQQPYPGVPQHGYGGGPTYQQPPGYPPQQYAPQQVPPSGGFPAQQPHAGRQAGFAQPGYQQPQQFPGVPTGYGPAGQPSVFEKAGSGGSGKKKALVFGGSGAVLVIVAAVLVLGFAWPGFFTTTVLDRQAVQHGVTNILTNDYHGGTVSAVSCPSGQEVAPGNTFTCTATVDGARKTVTITIKTDDGRYVVGRPQ